MFCVWALRINATPQRNHLISGNNQAPPMVVKHRRDEGDTRHPSKFMRVEGEKKKNGYYFMCCFNFMCALCYRNVDHACNTILTLNINMGITWMIINPWKNSLIHIIYQNTHSETCRMFEGMVFVVVDLMEGANNFKDLIKQHGGQVSSVLNKKVSCELYLTIILSYLIGFWNAGRLSYSNIRGSKS